MGNKKATKRITVRRAATFLAALGALVMSSGVALMVTATPANADPDPKIVVCKYVDTPGGQLQSGNNPIEVSLNTLKNVVDDEWLANPTFPKSWNDAHGQSGGSTAVGYVGEVPSTIDSCTGTPPVPDVATASVTFTDPTCDNGNVASFSTSGENVTFDDPAATAGTSITVTATATGDAEFEGGGTSATFDHTFPAAADCSSVTPPIVSPPVVKPPTTTHHTTVTPTVVHAGLAGVSSEDMRSEQGLALMFAGMVMLVAAGGLGLRLRGSESRI